MLRLRVPVAGGAERPPRRAGAAPFAAAAADGWACWAFSNHDVERHATRWSLDPAQLRVYLALLLSLRGSVCLYQGEELGLTEAYVPYEDLQDPYGKRFWPKFRGRDGCRTPMVWLSDNLHGGFSDVKPWLPVALEHLRMAVAAQEADAGLDARLLPADAGLAEGAAGARQGQLRDRSETSDSLISYVRAHDGEAVFCAFNLGPEPVVAALPDGGWRAIEDSRLRRRGSSAGPSSCRRTRRCSRSAT